MFGYEQSNGCIIFRYFLFKLYNKSFKWNLVIDINIDGAMTSNLPVFSVHEYHAQQALDSVQAIISEYQIAIILFWASHS